MVVMVMVMVVAVMAVIIVMIVVIVICDGGGLAGGVSACVLRVGGEGELDLGETLTVW